VKITYFNKREKRVRGVILSQKLTLNHSSSLMNEREEIKVLMTTYKKKRKERY